jgi:Sulfotransferase domain
MSVTKRIIAGVKRACGLHHPARNLAVYPDDTFVISYPKSGNTWTRFLIANLIHPEEPATFANIDRLIPESEELTKRQLDRLPRPRIMKTHQYFDPRYPRVIYIVRDPRDVVVSEYHFFRKRRWIDDDFPVAQFVGRFLSGKTSDYGSWEENVSSWVATRHNHPLFLLLRYEDMLAETTDCLIKIASFLRVQATPDQLNQAVERSSADEMRKLERTAAPGASSVTRIGRADIPFVRAASAGGWKDILPESSVAEIEAKLGPLMQWLGYDLLSPRTFDGPHASFPAAVLGERQS